MPHMHGQPAVNIMQNIKNIYHSMTNQPVSSLSAAISAFWIRFGIIRPSSPTAECSRLASRSTNKTSQHTTQSSSSHLLSYFHYPHVEISTPLGVVISHDQAMFGVAHAAQGPKFRILFHRGLQPN